MALFPSIMPPAHPIFRRPRWSNLVTPMRSGKKNRTADVVFPEWSIMAQWQSLSEADADQIMTFFNTVAKGSLNAFRFVWPRSRAYVKEFVGKGGVSTTTYNLPCKEGSAPTTTAYVNNVETSVTFNSGAGADGLDQIVFNPAPIEGATITASFTAKWAPLVIFPDEISEEYFEYLLYRHGQITMTSVYE